MSYACNGMYRLHFYLIYEFHPAFVSFFLSPIRLIQKQIWPKISLCVPHHYYSVLLLSFHYSSIRRSNTRALDNEYTIYLYTFYIPKTKCRIFWYIQQINAVEQISCVIHTHVQNSFATECLYSPVTTCHIHGGRYFVWNCTVYAACI